jgi:hypothetical protein
MKPHINATWNFEFDSIEQYISNLNPEKVLPFAESSKDVRLKSFTGTTSFNESVEIARSGYQVESVKIVIDKLNNNLITTEQNYRNEVCGAYVDIGMYLGGEPECMVTFDEQEVVKYIDVLVMMNESCEVSTNQYMNKGIATACLVDYLESNNYRVRLRGMKYNRIFGKIFTEKITIKEYNQSLSIAQIMGVLHSGFYRRIAFRHLEERCAEHGLDPNKDGYGFSVPLAAISKEVIGDAIVIPSQSSGVLDWSKQDKVKWNVEKLVKEFMARNTAMAEVAR